MSVQNCNQIVDGKPISSQSVVILDITHGTVVKSL